MIQFISLSSGSNGNCYYLGNEQTALLIDVGIGGRTIKKRLEDNNLSISNVQMILEPLGGGGNTATAGAQVKNATVKEVLDRLLTSIDKYYDET